MIANPNRNRNRNRNRLRRQRIESISCECSDCSPPLANRSALTTKQTEGISSGHWIGPRLLLGVIAFSRVCFWISMHCVFIFLFSMRPKVHSSWVRTSWLLLECRKKHGMLDYPEIVKRPICLNDLVVSDPVSNAWLQYDGTRGCTLRVKPSVPLSVLRCDAVRYE